MTGIERLVDIVTDGPYSGGMIHISVQKLREICEQIENELEDMRGRLMPEGIKWPMFEDNELVGFGDEYVNAKGNVSTLRTIVIKDCRDRLGGGYYWKLGKGACAVVIENGERIKRPHVLAADGKPLEVGQTVWGEVGTEFAVKSINHKLKQFTAIRKYDGCECSGLNPMIFTHKRPVLDADGVPIKEGDTVWPKYPYEEPDRQVESAEVVYVNRLGRIDIQGKYATGMSFRQQVDAKQLTHTKPEPDSWSSVWADVSNGNETPEGMMRRCRALAERGE